MEEFNSLGKLMELPPEQFMQGMRAMEGIRQADQQKLMQTQLANQQQTLANQFAQQNNPIKQQQAEFNLSRDQQTLPGALAQSRGLVRAEDQAGDLTPDKLPAALTMAAAMAGQPGMQTPALHGQMRKILKNAYVPEIMDAWTPQQFGANLGEMVKRYSEYMPKQLGAMAQIEAKGDTAEEVAKIRAAAVAKAAAAKKASDKKGRDFVASLDKIKNPIEKFTAIKAEMARLEPDDPAQTYLGRMLNEVAPLAQEEVTRKANPTGFVQGTDGKWAPRAPAVINNPATAVTPAPATAGRADRQAAATRITIYKDGKAVGTIPESQRQQAITEGYTIK